MALDLTGLLTEDPGDPENYKFVVVGDVNGWLPISDSDVAARAADSAPRPATIADVMIERARRLSLGFNYDFGDARGVHHIGTTDADMLGWREVTDASNALIALGQPNATLQIVTDTGPATITAMEFQSVLAAAALARQPIWAASFALQAMSPIPSDYAADSYWL